MAIKCILLDDKNKIIDYAGLSFINTETAVLVPFDKDTLIKYKIGQKIRFQFENKYDEVFDGEISEFCKESISLKNIKDIAADLHGDVRVDVELDSCILYEAGEDCFSIDIRIRNISSGGMSFLCEKALDMNMIYETVVEWVETPIIVKLKLLRKEPEGESLFLYGCKFISLLHTEESLLRAGVFYIQAKKFKLKRERS